MLRNFVTYFNRSSDEQRLMIAILLIAAMISSVVSAYDYYSKNLTIAYLGTLFSLTVLVAITLLYHDKISPDRTSLVIVGLIFLLLIGGFVMAQNKIEATLYLLGFPVALIALRPAHDWLVMMLFFVFAIMVAHLFAWTHSRFYWREIAQIWLVLGMTSLFLGYYVSMSRRTKKELDRQKKALGEVNYLLEAKVAERTKELQRVNEQLNLDLRIDALTGTGSKRNFLEKLREQLNRHRYDKTVFSLISFDIDDFSLVNHAYGRKTGDEILQKIAKLVMDHSRKVDLVARMGGDEFILLMYDTKYADAIAMADKLRQHIEWAVFLDKHQITASFGVVEVEAGMDEHTMLHKVEMARQKAKHRGKNQLCCLHKEEVITGV